MPGDIEKNEQLEKSIAEQYAEEMLQIENANKLAREKRKKKIVEEKMRSSLFDERDNQSPNMISEAEQFQNLQKGDIGEEEWTGKKKKAEEQESEDGFAGQRNQNAVNYDKQITNETSDYRLNRQQQNTANFRLEPQNRNFTNNIKREITTTEQELTKLKFLEKTASGARSVKAIIRWFQIVGASYSTVILGIILTILSVFVVPLLLIAGMTGILPKTVKEKTIEKKIKEIEEKLSKQKRMLLNKK